MTDVLLPLLGLIVGVAVGVYFGILRGKAALATEVARVSGEAARLGAALEEVRGQLAGREAELESVRQALQAEKVGAAESKTRLEAAREGLAGQQRQIQEMEQKVKESFGALSSAALRNNNEQFLTLADAKLKPIREQLERYEKQIGDLEKARQQAYGGLDKHLAVLEQRSDKLSHETGQLAAALRQPGIKGKWGEVTLQRIVELAGMTEHCDFELQATLESGQRPDLIVRMPGGRTLAVDSKVNTGAYLDAVNATDENQRRGHLARFAGDVRSTMKMLSGKEYWRELSPAPEFVVMFMPGEAFFAAAMSQDHELLVDGVQSRVLPASPTTLIALLLAVQHGWQQAQVTENAQRIADAGRELYERLCSFVKHLDGVREGIEKAAKAYDQAVGNWDRRTLPSVQKLRDLGAAQGGAELSQLQAAEVKMRQISTPEEIP